ncbi:DNA translocase FtsK [Bacteroidia bacterium]|nr:DNA translocase FtsK [Bacteroidia bacterium]
MARTKIPINLLIFAGATPTINMTKKNKTRRHTNDDGWFDAVKTFLSNERTRFITGLLISILTVYIGLAILSFFFAGASDQSKIENVPLNSLVNNKISVDNWTGVRGAYLADVLINRWFGISAFMLLFFLGSLGAKLMNARGISLIKRFLFSFSWLIWGSLFFAFAFAWTEESTFLYFGGMTGKHLSEWLQGNIGIPGTILLLIASGLTIAILSSSRTLPFLQRQLTIRFRLPEWMKWKKKYDEEDEDDDEEDVIEEEKPVKKVVDAPPPPEDADDGFVVTVAPEEEAYEAIGPIDFPDIDKETDTDNPLDDEEFEDPELEEYDPKLDLSTFRNPTIDLLKAYDNKSHQVDMTEQNDNQKRIKQTLEDFGISIVSIKATVGPTITLYEVVPDVGVRIAKIRNLEEDIALKLAATGIRIIAPMPGKGTIGIEVPNKDPQIVSMQSIINSRRFQESTYDLPVALGKTITNEIFMFDLCKMPHLLVAGATGQGKSVGLNAIITSLLYKKHPSELKFVLVDPKMVEFSNYAEIEKHYLAKLPDGDKPIITDYKKVIQTLNSLCKEMDDRYDLLMKAHVRNIKDYNEKFKHRRLNPLKGHRFMPFIVVIIDEFGDLIMTAGKEIEMPISRIAQKARAIGIHLIIATQRPTTNIITGTIKANFPARMAFRVASMMDSRTILDAPGANRLIGRGDMLFSQGNDMIRVQCAFVDTPEVDLISSYIGKQTGFAHAFELPEFQVEGEGGDSAGGVDLSDRDPMFDEVAHLIVSQQQGSTSLIQRKFSIGYNRAGRLMDQLEAAGIVGPYEGSKARQVLIQDEYSLEQLLRNFK